MTVKELREALEQVMDQNMPVFCYPTDSDCELYSIKSVDYDLLDRVDLNIQIEEPPK